MTPYSPPPSPTPPPLSLRLLRAVIALILSVICVAGSILMIGPQIIVIVPLAIVIGVLFAVRRSFWSLAWFGYPFTFGLLSAWIGYHEIPGYEQTLDFAISIGIGLIGWFLIAAGLWLSLPHRRLEAPEGHA